MYLLVWEAWHCVDVFLLDHERSQVSSVGGQKDDSKEGPDQHHDLAGGSSGVLHRHWVVKDNGPQEPDGFPYREGGATRLWPGGMERKTKRERVQNEILFCFFLPPFQKTARTENWLQTSYATWMMISWGASLKTVGERFDTDPCQGGLDPTKKKKKREAPIEIPRAPELLSRLNNSRVRRWEGSTKKACGRKDIVK